MKSGLMGAGIGGSAATHSRHSHPGNYVSRDDANTVIGDRPTLRSGSFPKGEGRSVEIPQKDKGGPQVPCSSSSAVLSRKLPQRCSTAYMETAMPFNEAVVAAPPDVRFGVCAEGILPGGLTPRGLGTLFWSSCLVLRSPLLRPNASWRVMRGTCRHLGQAQSSTQAVSLGAGLRRTFHPPAWSQAG